MNLSELFDIKSVKSDDLEVDWSTTKDETIKYNYTKEAVMTFEDLKINEEAMDVLLGDARCSEGEFEILVPKKVQARTHRKHKVNKKWLKRYGYKTIYDTKIVLAKKIEIKAEDYPYDDRLSATFELQLND